MVKQVYNIAFAGKPNEKFIPTIRELSKKDGIELLAVLIVDGPGCRNLAILLEENDKFVEALTMALMPAKYSKLGETNGVISEGLFEDLSS